MIGLPRHHTMWWWRHFEWRDCPLREYAFVSGGILRLPASELQREGVVEWLESVGMRYVRAAALPWEESLRNPAMGRYMEVLRVWSREVWPLGSSHARALIRRYA